ncbi:MAG: hypothetical protein WDN00_07020 [Limisphaerales bacterium]
MNREDSLILQRDSRTVTFLPVACVLRGMRKQLCLLVSLLMLANPFASAAEKDGFQQMTFTVDGVERTALVYIPPAAKTKATPVVFVFHGHGGNSRQVARSFKMNSEWPDAISVYMQGLPTPGQLSDPQGKETRLAGGGW